MTDIEKSFQQGWGNDNVAFSGPSIENELDESSNLVRPNETSRAIGALKAQEMISEALQ